jgi:hypothetical protein
LMQKLNAVSIPKFESCFVFIIRNTIITRYKSFPSSHHIFFYRWHKLSFELDFINEHGHTWVGITNSKKT